MSGPFSLCIIIASIRVIPECILPILVPSYLHFEYSRVDSLKYDDYFTESPPFFCHLHFPRVNPVLGLWTLVHSLLFLWSLSILRDLFYDGMQ